ncbi:uncharacterized protein LOC129809195 isoform X2 [Phlebotomus papatasi]|nr:uncharacterized protein LOC129809195 isoform X2 [Phlebotomus papatasi]
MVQVLGKEKSFNKKFSLTQLGVRFLLKKPETSPDYAWLREALQEIISIIQSEGNIGDKATMEFHLPQNPEVTPIYVGLTPIHALAPENLFSRFEKVNQSNATFGASEELLITSSIVHMMQGRGQNKTANMDFNEIKRYKKFSVVDPGVKEFCLPIALLMGRILNMKNKDRRKKTLNSCRRYTKKLRTQAINMVKQCGAAISLNGEYDLNFISVFSAKFPKYLITVYNKLGDCKGIIFKSPKSEKNSENRINLFYDEKERHYFCISNVASFFNFRHQCETCDALYNHNHKCPGRCRYCNKKPPCLYVDSLKKCDDCNREFRGEDCYNYHKEKTCDAFKICPTCDTFYKVASNHKCNTSKCYSCNKIVEKPHYCYIQSFKSKPPKEFQIIFYDFECQFLDEGQGFYRHSPNICVTNIVCHLCYESSSFPAVCPNCNPFENVFSNDNTSTCVTKFINYVFKFRKWPVVAIAHNAKGYDAQFILEELCNRDLKINPILVGRKILCISVNQVTFIDSIAFIPLALSKFSASFGLVDCNKGEYPYKFNTPENENYIGSYPPIEYYPIDSMSSDKFTKFVKWYNENKHRPFNNREELIKYCQQDVHILRAGCLYFMISFLETTGISPFLQAVTIADAVMKAYRKNYLRENTLGITPKNNYNPNFIHYQSKIGLKWLIFQKQRSFPNLRYEVKIKNTNFIVDGYDEESNTVFEFFGCFYHGHTCLQDRKYQCSKDPLDTLGNRYEMTMHRLSKLRKLGYKLKFTWECEFRKLLKYDQVLNNSIDNHREIINAGFDLRAAVYGGRTEVFKLYCKAQPGDKMYYYDFTSLYPWANKYTKYFSGHPTIIRDFTDPCEILSYDGVAKCKVLPPRSLYLPVLPYRCDNRLTFPLCAMCVLEKSDLDECTHTDNERSLLGYWALDEIRLAVENGYIILEALELWSYEPIQYDRDSGERGLFADYVDNFLKIKQESSGWPEGCESDDSKDQYLENYRLKEGIELNRENITLNKGRRSLSKLMLNSLWGKFIQREDLKKTEICSSQEELMAFVTNEGIEVHQLNLCGPNKIFVTWSHLTDCLPESKHVNLGVGICTTTNARIALYKALSRVGKNVLYCDTDSIIYLVPKGEENPLKVGSFLGELTDELSSYGEGSYIDEYVSTGPKSYGIRILNPTTGTYSYKVVFKGITMNRHVEEKVNFDALKELVNGGDPIEVQYKDTIFRGSHFKMSSGPSTKTAKFTFDKRRCVANFNTLPYGY